MIRDWILARTCDAYWYSDEKMDPLSVSHEIEKNLVMITNEWSRLLSSAPSGVTFVYHNAACKP